MQRSSLNGRVERDALGRAVINMSVKNDEEFLSVFSRSESPVISSDVAEFIENSAAALSPKEQITIRIYSSCIDENEKIVYSWAIRQYYREKELANDTDIKRNSIIALILLIAGIAVLALSAFLNIQLDGEIWSEFIDIVAWVLLWEFVDICVFKNMHLRLSRRRYSAFSSMNIEFYSS